MAWAFEDESDDYTEAVLDSLASAQALVPAVWHLEVVNVLITAGKRGRLSAADALGFIAFLDTLPISTPSDACEKRMSELLSLAREHALTSYDASYLLLAMKSGLPLATKDKALRRAAKKAGVPIWPLPGR